jgi:hypothetical protein
VSKIADIYRRREISFFELCKMYAARAENLFTSMQRNEEFWNNHSFQALEGVFGEAYKDSDFIGFFLAHGKDYGVYLELANDRQNEALRPIINTLYKDFMEDLKKLYGAN